MYVSAPIGSEGFVQIDPYSGVILGWERASWRHGDGSIVGEANNSLVLAYTIGIGVRVAVVTAGAAWQTTSAWGGGVVTADTWSFWLGGAF